MCASVRFVIAFVSDLQLNTHLHFCSGTFNYRYSDHQLQLP